MIRLVRAEWTKLFTTRVWIGLLLGACVMAGGFAALFTGFAGRTQNGSRASRRSAPAVRAAGASPSAANATRAAPDPRHHRDDPGVPAPHGDADVPHRRRAAAGWSSPSCCAYALVAVPFALLDRSPSTCWW